MRHFISFFAILFSALSANAAEVTDFTLDNGLEVVVLEDHRAPVVVQMLWYRVGAADEPPGKSGIAHFLEHLLFKSTDDMEAGDFSAIIARNGGNDNAFTSFDYTGYWQRIAANRLELVMQMEADRMRDLRMTEEDVATELQVILEERSQRTDSEPNALFREQSNAALFLNHPYGIPIVGWRHEMETLTREDALEFYRRYYAPNNAILIVAGDVDPAEVRQLAETYYGPLEPTPNLPERMRPQEPPQIAERRLVYKDPRISQPYIVRSYLAPERDSGNQQEAARLRLLAEVLGGEGATSVLGQKLQFDTQTAVYANAAYSPTSLDDGMFTLIIVPTPSFDLPAAENAMDQAIAEFMEEGIDPEMFERIKFEMRARQIYAEDNVQSAAQRYGAALASGLTLKDIEEWPDILQAVTIDEVMEAAEILFDRRRAVTGYVSAPDQEG